MTGARGPVTTGAQDVVESAPRSRGWAVVAAVTGAVVVATLLARPAGDERAAPTPSGATSPDGAVATTVRPPIRALLAGPADTAPYGPLLVLSEFRLFRFARRTMPRELDESLGSFSPGFVWTRGGTVIVNGDARGGGPAAYLAKGSTDPVPLGTADRAAPAVDDTTVWLQAGRIARRVRVPGGREVERRSLPARTALAAEVPDGLLLNSLDRPAATVVNGGEVVRRLDARVVRASPAYAVLVDETCAPWCVQTVDTRTWTLRTFHGYDAERPPALSPDGSTIAGYALAVDGTARLLAFDVTSRREIAVANSAVSATTGASAAWTRDSGTLYVVLTEDPGGSQLAVWHRDAGAMAVQRDVRPPLTAVWPE